MKGKTMPPIALFRGLAEDETAYFASLAIPRSMPRGGHVFFEGDHAMGFFVVVSGRVKITKLSPEGKEQILHIMKPGDHFGEVPMFVGGSFPANAVAMEDVELLLFTKERFMEIIGRYPALAMNMLASLSQRLIHLTGLVEDLSLREVHERLAAYLLHLSDTQDNAAVVLDINKGQLASLLGTIPETLSRILTKLHNDGLIAVEGRKIAILNRKGLRWMADKAECPGTETDG